jgi:integrase
MFLVKGHKQVYYIRFKKPDNKWTQRTTGTTIKSEAKEFLKNFKNNHIAKKVSNTTVYQNPSLKHFFEDLLKKSEAFYSKRDLQGFKLLAKRFVLYVGNKDIQELNTFDVETYLALRAKDTYRGHVISKSSVNIDLRVLKMLFNRAIRWSMLEKNPCKGIKQFKSPQQERISLTSSEIKSIIDVSEDTDLKKVIIYAVLTGCRIGEIVNLEWKDINFIKSYILVVNKKNFQTKSRKIRQIPMSTVLKNYLLEWSNSRSNFSDYVFLNKKGYKSNSGYLTKKFKSLVRQLNLSERYCFHCLRHTFATNFLQATGNVYFLKQLMGHSDIKVTEQYLHYTNTDLINQVNIMPKLVG